MIDFERYLVDNGFEVKRKVMKNGNWIYEDGYRTPSTMMNIDNRYIKADLEIVIGLHEVGKPITLIYPRPKGICMDDDMNRFLLNNSNLDVLKSIYDNNIH